MISDVEFLKESWSLELNSLSEMALLSVSSRKRVHWNCLQCGHVYQRSIVTQFRNKGACPRCQQLQNNIKKSLAVSHPEIADCLMDEKNEGWTAQHVTASSHRKLWWECSVCHRDYSMSVAQRVKSVKCPYCSGKRVCSDNSLASLNPAAAAQWSTSLNQGLKPSDVTANSNKEFWFECRVCHHTWLARCNARTSLGTDCPECSKRRLQERMKARHLAPCLNNLTVTHPELASQWHPTLNEDIPILAIKAKSNRSVWWKCSLCQHEWEAKVVRRTQTIKGQSCPSCGEIPS